MPSQQHETLLELFRNAPELAATLLRESLGYSLPDYTEAIIDSADLSQVQPAEYRADMVVLLKQGKPVLGIVLEVQLSREKAKRYSWPAYAVTLRARIRCDALVLVVCGDDSVAGWCARPLHLGGDNYFRPLVVGPEGVPEVLDPEIAQKSPELAVLSAMAHGHDEDTPKSIKIVLLAMNAIQTLPETQNPLYSDMIFASLGEAARKALRSMDLNNYEWQSDFAKKYVGIGREEGRLEGREEGRQLGERHMLETQLKAKFGTLSLASLQKLDEANEEALTRWGTKILSATTLDEVLE